MLRRGTRGLLAAIAISAVASLSGCVVQERNAATAVAAAIPARQAFDPFLAELEERTFRFFWDTANPETGLIPDRYPSPSFSSISATGFGLTAYGIGAERGYITREAARDRVLLTLRFLRNAPQGNSVHGSSGYKGFFYHFLDMRTGERYKDTELSTLDTAQLLAGVLFVQSYFDANNAVEAEIREIADELYTRVDWRWAQPRPPSIVLGWKPESGFIPEDYHGYHEAMPAYLLALGSPTLGVGADAWAEWTSTYDETWRTYYGQEHLGYHPLFTHQYTHVWVDFRGIQDGYMRRRGIDYFENSRRATYAQRAYAIENPMRWKGYGENVWGITACDGPLDVKAEYDGTLRTFRSYAGRGMGGAHTYDDGTIAPTGAVASIPFAPEIAIPAVKEMHKRFGQHIYARYGFLDAFNLTFDLDLPLRHGHTVPGFGWVDSDYLGIDQGAIVAMIENYRAGTVWRTMRRNAHLRRALELAGFTGGWLSTQAVPGNLR